MSIASALKEFEGARVLVIGDIILDIYIYGSVDRISPEAPIPILNHKNTRHALGGAANVAANLRGLGADVHLVSITGEDDEADFLTTMLDLEEIQHDLIRLKNRPTTSKSRVISGAHQLLRIDHETTLEIDAQESDLLSAKIKEVIHHFQPAILVLEDYNKGMMNSTIIDHLNQLAASIGIPVVVDPKKNHFFDYKGCTLFKPNFKECAQQMPFAITPDLESLKEADRYLRGILKNKYTMITLAEHGIYISDGEKSLIAPTEIRKVSDVSGAGDTVTAIATFGVIQSLSLESIASLANIAAGLVCSKPGVYAIHKEELIQNNN